MELPIRILGTKIYHLPDTTVYYLWLSNYDRATITPISSKDAYFISNSLGVPINHKTPREYYEGIQLNIDDET